MDDLKQLWQQNQPAPPLDEATFRQAIERETHRSTSRLQTTVWVEFGIGFALFALLTWGYLEGFFYNSRTVGAMICLGFLTLVPVFYRLLRAVRGFSDLDFSKNVVENLRAAVLKMRREVRFYLVSFYVFTAAMLVLVLIDPFSWPKKAVFVGFLLLNAATGKHWVQWLYGKKLDALERQLAEWEAAAEA